MIKFDSQLKVLLINYMHVQYSTTSYKIKYYLLLRVDINTFETLLLSTAFRNDNCLLAFSDKLLDLVPSRKDDCVRSELLFEFFLESDAMDEVFFG